MAKPPKEVREGMAFLESATACPACGQETTNRGEILQKGVVICTMPICSEEHLAIFMKRVMETQQLSPEERKHVKMQFNIRN